MNHIERFRDRLPGVVGFPVTPFRDDYSLDLPALEENVKRMMSHPFSAIVVAGGTGELYSLSPEEVLEICRTARRIIGDSCLLIAGVGFSLAIARQLASGLEDAGADGLLLFPPYYTNAPREGLLNYYIRVAAATTLPVIIYSRDWAVFTPEMVWELSERIPNLVAWKDGQGDVRRYQRIMSYIGDRLVWLGGAGDDCVPGYYSIGVQGYTSSISNIAPKLSIELGNLGLKGDFEKLNVLMHKYVHPLYHLRDRSRGYEVAVMKKAMELLGFKAGPVRPPLKECTEEEVERLKQILAAYKDYL